MHVDHDLRAEAVAEPPPAAVRVTDHELATAESFECAKHNALRDRSREPHGFTVPWPATNDGLWKNGTRLSLSSAAFRWINEITFAGING